MQQLIGQLSPKRSPNLGNFPLQHLNTTDECRSEATTDKQNTEVKSLHGMVSTLCFTLEVDHQCLPLEQSVGLAFLFLFYFFIYGGLLATDVERQLVQESKWPSWYLM